MNDDAGTVLFLMHLRDRDFLGGGGVEPIDSVGAFFKSADFAVQSGCNMEKLSRECVSNTFRCENLLAKSRLVIEFRKTAEDTNGAPLAKGEISSRMHKLLDELRADATADEARRMASAIECADIPCFSQIAEGVVARMKRKAA